MTTIDRTTMTPRERLIDLAHWLTHEERKRRMGLTSEWNQSVWVGVPDQEDDLPSIDVTRDGDVVLTNWSCGTAACAAGRVTLDDGGLPAFYWPRWRDRGDGEHHPYPSDLEYLDDELSTSAMYVGGRVEQIEEYAARVLGLDGSEAGRLFEGSNDWEDMMDLIAEFTGVEYGELLSLVGAENMPPSPEETYEGE